MKRVVVLMAAFLLGLGFYLTDTQAKIPGEENLIQKIKEVLTPAISAPKNLPQDFHPVCATPAFVWITGHRDELSPEAQKELSLLVPAGRPTYSTTENTYDTPGGISESIMLPPQSIRFINRMWMYRLQTGSRIMSISLVEL